MREFCVSLGNATLTSSPTVIFLNPKAAPSLNIELLRWWIGFSGTATSAQQRVQINSQVSTFPTLTAATPASLKRGDPNASILVGSTSGAAATAGVNASGEGNGAQTQILDDAFNVLNGWLMVPTPPETIIMPAGSTSGIGMKFPTTPSQSNPWSFGCNYREV